MALGGPIMVLICITTNHDSYIKANNVWLKTQHRQFIFNRLQDNRPNDTVLSAGMLSCFTQAHYSFPKTQTARSPWLMDSVEEDCILFLFSLHIFDRQSCFSQICHGIIEGLSHAWCQLYYRVITFCRQIINKRIK